MVAAVATPWLRDVCLRQGWLDAPGGRHGHAAPTPRLGGVAVAAAFFVALLVVGLSDHRAAHLLLGDGRRVLALVLGGAAALGIGVADDLMGLRPMTKLAGQVVVASVVAGLGLRVELLAVPGLGLVEPGLLAIPVTVAWLVLVTNAMNLIDGLDGLAAGVSLTVVAALLGVSTHNGMAVGVLLGCALAGGLAGFLRHNAPPASVFLGDSGSQFLGFALGAWSILSWQKSATGIAVLSVALIFALPLLDTAWAILRRVARGQSPMRADDEHLHHQLARTPLGPGRSALVLVLVAAATTAAAVALL